MNSLPPIAEPILERDDEFATLMTRVQAGCQASIAVLLNRYGPYILLAVRRRLNQRLRSKYDSFDFVQDVWASFFANIPTKHTFESPEKLIAFLTTMASNKVAETVRTRMQRQKYNVNRECPLDQDPDRMQFLRANTPTPSEVVMGREAWDILLDGQPLVHRHILTLVRGGKEASSIAEELGISARTVRRVIQKNLPGFEA